VGLFSRKPKQDAGAAAAAAPPAGAPAGDDPLVPLLGLTVDQAAFADGTLTLTFKGPAGEAHLEAYGRAFMAEGGVPSIAGTPPFVALLKQAPGRKVVGAIMRVGDTLSIELEGGIAAVASLRPGDFAGTTAVYLKGPGRSYVSFHDAGFARLAM
jgi:hypothetical protein